MGVAQRIIIVFLAGIGMLHAQRAPLHLYSTTELSAAQKARLDVLLLSYHLQEATEVQMDSLGGLLFMSQQYKPALEVYEDLCQINPDRFEYHFRRGAAAGFVLEVVPKIRALPYLTSLKSGFEEAVRLNPNSIAAKRALISVYVDLPRILGGNLQKALQICADIESLSPFEGALAYVWYASKTHQVDLAKKYMQLALDVKKKEIRVNDARYEFATIAWLWGNDPDLARTYFKTFIEYAQPGDLYPAVFAQYRIAEITALNWNENSLNITKERIVKQFPNIESCIETFDPIGSVIKDVL